MTEEEKAAFVAMDARIFVRALRDPIGADTEFELSEGQATSLLRARERAAVTAFLEAVSEDEIGDAILDCEDMDTNSVHRARAAIAALKELAK